MSGHGVTLGVLVVMALATPQLAHAQSLPATLDSGTLVRMHPPTGLPTRGRLIQAATRSSELLRFCRYPAPECTAASRSEAFGEVNLASLEHLDVRVGGKWGWGAAIGAVIGFGIGSLLAEFDETYCQRYECRSQVKMRLVPTIGFATLGALIGNGSSRWRRVF